ncbi:hypothetical protein GCM10011581_33850 [Saccharopolyspora subtropica]|uniref:Uncharacterized protein n=1 Tax=Saccharopolyspora thermophila TaxID=89367 RepID=A0A917JZK6_9PSEU|nr:hypothetical protein [Saccharopolyspora subtropica]GGI93944.1 hypothetical protein GCM10011581_33850 [Saccharopolyspora subtropica]
MCESRQEMHGDPEAMRRFVEQLVDLDTAAVLEPPGAPCPGGMQACARFTAADVASTRALASFLAETGAAIAALRAAAAEAAEDYLTTDRVGAHAVVGAVFVVVED